MNILIADDSPLARAVVARHIKDIGILEEDNNIFFAKDGEEAINQYKQNRPAVVFMDLTMPNVNGFQAIEEIISFDKNAKIIAVSADIQEKAVQKIKDLGAIGFIKKPIDNNEKLLSIFQHLGYMEDMEEQIEFSETQKAILQELMNIAYGKGTAAIADVIESFAALAIPEIEILTPKNLTKYLSQGGYENKKNYIATQILHGDINGESLFMMDEESTKKLAYEFKLHADMEDSIFSSIVLEIANILSITTVGELAQSFNTEVNFEPPNIQLYGCLSEIDDSYFANYQQIIAISTLLQFEEQNIEGKLILLINDQSIEWLQNQLAEIAKEYF